jgi:Tfp pilus assembly protein PilE
MKISQSQITEERGSTLVVTIAVVATILALLASAVSYTQHVSRLADRSRKTALAVEIADGHLEYLFTNWRNIYRKTWTTNTIGALDAALVGTNYFYTDLYKTGGVGCSYNGAPCSAPTPIPNMSPSATPSPIPLPNPAANFPSGSTDTVTQYRIQAVDPMITLSTDGSERAWVEDQTQKGKGSKIPPGTSTPPNGWLEMNPASPPPAAYGPNTWQYSFYYLASVDITVPAMTGTVTAKVRRVFEKRFDNPWTYAMFYAGDLELHPNTSLTITGPIHTNGNLYISTSNFNAQSSVAYSGEYVNNYSPNDTSSHAGPISTPNFANGLPPVQEGAFQPFG